MLWCTTLPHTAVSGLGTIWDLRASAREYYSLGLGRKHESGGISHVFQEAVWSNIHVEKKRGAIMRSLSPSDPEMITQQLMTCFLGWRLRTALKPSLAEYGDRA